MKKRKEIEDKVIQILADKLKIKKENINSGSHLLDDLGADSLNAIEIIYCLEEEFGTTISQDKFNNIRRVRDIVNILSK